MSWPVVPISEICITGSGTTPSRKDSVFYDGNIPWIKSGELKENLISSSEECVTEEALKKTSLKMVPRGAILVAMYGATVGRVGMLDIDATTNQAICHLVPRDGSVDREYLYHTMQAKAPYLISKGVGGAQPNITQGIIKDTKIPLPPLKEQKRIAAILNQADALRRLRQRAIDRLNTLGQAIFYDMFGDPARNSKNLETAKLGDISEFYSGNSLPDAQQFIGDTDGYLLLKVSDLNRTENAREIVESAEWSAAAGTKASTCPSGSIVFPKRGGAIGTNKKRVLRRDAILDPNLMGVHPDSNIILSEFLFSWFETFNLSDIASGSSVPQLNKKDLAPLEVILPDMAAQKTFQRKIGRVLNEIKLNERSLDNLDDMFLTLQHSAFKGEL